MVVDRLTLLRMLAFVIRDGGDRFCLRIVYRGKKGVRKDRFISPTSWFDESHREFHALCLTTGETRRMRVAQVESAVVVSSHQVLIPMEQVVVDDVVEMEVVS